MRTYFTRYLHTITALANHYHRRPDELTQEQIKAYLLYIIETKGYAKSTFNVNLFAIRFLYQKTLGREWCFLQLTRVKTNRRLPIVLSRDEVWRCPSIASTKVPVQELRW